MTKLPKTITDLMSRFFTLPKPAFPDVTPPSARPRGRPECDEDDVVVSMEDCCGGRVQVVKLAIHFLAGQVGETDEQYLQRQGAYVEEQASIFNRGFRDGYSGRDEDDDFCFDDGYDGYHVGHKAGCYFREKEDDALTSRKPAA
jgi:hypothetical protein